MHPSYDDTFQPNVEKKTLGIVTSHDVLRIFKHALLEYQDSDELQESLGPSGTEIPKTSEKKKSPGASGPGVSKSLAKVSKSLTSLEKSGKSLKECAFETFSRLFPDIFGPRKDCFLDFLGISGPEGSRDSCSSSMTANKS